MLKQKFQYNILAFKFSCQVGRLKLNPNSQRNSQLQILLKTTKHLLFHAERMHSVQSATNYYNSLRRWSCGVEQSADQHSICTNTLYFQESAQDSFVFTVVFCTLIFINLIRVAYVVQRPCSDFMDMLWRLIHCRIIITIIIFLLLIFSFFYIIFPHFL